MTESEAILRAYTVALSYVTTRDRADAMALLEERIAFWREEIRREKQREGGDA